LDSADPVDCGVRCDERDGTEAPVLPAAPYVLAADGTPYSPLYDDVYHAAAGAHAQSRHVFLAGNGLPERWRRREAFTILETGFGLGVNFLATWLAWREDPLACEKLEFVSLEKHPFTARDLRRAHLAWPEFAALSEELLASWPEETSGPAQAPVFAAGGHAIELDGGRVRLFLVFGDAVHTLPTLARSARRVDAFYLDGFAPSKNPELWSAQSFAALARLARDGATLATWSVAGSVRSALSAVGFRASRKPGFAAKRQMLVADYAAASTPE
jgi:tRNA 5-methylaminomethyl-2-thiouridine biosynthesis bifunctional protein